MSGAQNLNIPYWLNSKEKPAVSPMSGGSTFDIEKKTRNGANLKLRHALRAGGVKKTRNGGILRLRLAYGRQSN